MKIGIDLHGVADTYPEIKGLLQAMRDGGNEIYIISGPHTSKIIERLEDLAFHKDIHYDHIISVVEYLKEKGVKMWQDEKGDWWTNDEDWWKSKAMICTKHQIDIMIDDSEKYKEWFDYIIAPTKFVLFKKDIHQGKFKHIKGVDVHFQKRGGRPVIRGTRVEIARVMAEIAVDPVCIEAIKDNFLHLDEQDIRDAFEELSAYFGRKWVDK